MRGLVKYFSYFLLFFITIFYTIANGNIIDYRFYAGQVYDVQRFPVLPIANKPFSLTQFQDPFKENTMHYSLNNGEYIQLFYVGGFCKDGMVGINRFNAQGKFLETVQSEGHIYGLTSAGFLHDNNKNIGTFVSSHPLRNSETVIYIPVSGPNPETCSNLENYVKYISY